MHHEQARIQKNVCCYISAIVKNKQKTTILYCVLKEQVELTNCNPVETGEAAAVSEEALSPAEPANAEGDPFQFPVPFSETSVVSFYLLRAAFLHQFH
jgi:hypothetical protein